MIRREDSLAFHRDDRPGKIELRGTKPCLTPRDMRMAYLPGAAFPAQEIAVNREEVFRYTARGNLVGVITNGSAVPGLGDVGPEAAKPMQEGMAVLFKRLADIDVFDLELSAGDPDRFVETVRMLEPTFGAVNLKDIRAPDGLYIYDRLSQVLRIPVFHENLHGTAVVAAAALLNALDLAEKEIGAIRVVICGAGTVGIGCGRLLRRLGVPAEQILLYDVGGLIHFDRRDLTPYQREFACGTAPATLAEGLNGADVFLGASTGGVMSPDMIRSMSRFPIVVALASPQPEIGYAEARSVRRDVLVATSQSQDPNAVVDLLSFPYILRGALDSRATRITDGMLVAAARALADLAREDVIEEVVRAYGDEPMSFGPEYLLPKPIDPRIFVRESSAVARQAAADGVARRELQVAEYEERLAVHFGTGRETMRRLALKARQQALRVVFPEGANETILRACGVLLDEGIASPVLLGMEEEIRRQGARIGLDLSGMSVVDPARTPRREAYLETYFRMRQRHGVTRASAAKRLQQPEYFAALMVDAGDADMMISGVDAHYVESLQVVREIIGTPPGVRGLSGHYLVLLPKKVYVLADCTVTIDPDAEDLAEIALLAAGLGRSLGLEPRVAMLSFSNFGSVDHPFAQKVRRATGIVKDRAPGLAVDGEMQLSTAVNGVLRRKYFPFSELPEDANVLIFPDLQSGNLALHLLQAVGDAVLVGPVLLGSRRPVHLLQHGCSVEQIIHLTTIGAVQASGAQRGPN